MSQFIFQLGVRVVDRITEFAGVITGRAEYITGCKQYCVTPKSIDNKIAESGWFDEDRLDIPDHQSLIKAISFESKANGGPQICPAPTK